MKKEYRMPDADWRTAATTLAKDLPSNGRVPEHKKESTVRGTYPILVDRQLYYGMKMVPAPMMLSVAKRMKIAADELWLEIDIKGIPKEQLRGEYVLIPTELEEPMYDLYEHLMGCVVFSYASIEAFANSWFEPDKEYEVPDKDGTKTLKGVEVVRQINLQTKLLALLPGIFSINPPQKGRSPWQEFRGLEKLRHDIIHFKNHDLDREAAQFVKTKVQNNLFTRLLRALKDDPSHVAYLVMKKYLPNSLTKTIYPPHGIPHWFREFQTAWK